MRGDRVMNARQNKSNNSTIAGHGGKQGTYQNDGAYEQDVDEEVSRLGEATRLTLKGTAVAP